MNRNPQFSTWPAEKALLKKLLLKTPGTYAIEIGCFRGVTTRFLAEVCQKIGKQLIAIDPWNNSQDYSDDSVYHYFQETIKDFKQNVIVIRSLSDTAITQLSEVIKSNIGLIFVDGDHSYQGTYNDLVNYYPLLMKGGVIAVHDVFDKGWEGVGRAVDTFVKPGTKVHYLKYLPTTQETHLYQHGISGLAWWQK